ncbi:MAG TPA: glycosyltransferase family 4 protein [Armatimonadota bacterium]|jgi:glycosyltransferase involved in cell wall biosynthesis
MSRDGSPVKTVLYVQTGAAISGAERSLLAMLQALDRTQWRPVVAAPAGALLDAVARAGVQTVSVPLATLARPRRLAQYYAGWQAWRAGCRALDQVVQALAPSLIHANTTSAMLYTGTSLPSIWQVRDLTPLGPLGARLYRRATRVAAISSAVHDDLLRYAQDGGEKITLLPPAVDTARFHPQDDRASAREMLGLPADGPLLGLVAQFVPWKRHDLFLDALSLLADQPWQAVLAGADLHHAAGYLAALREHASRAPLAGRVHFLPWQNDPSLLLGALDLCVLTSRREPFGRVLIEAMACGVPTLAVDEGGVRDIVIPEETGVLCPADPPALAAALSRLLADAPWCARLGSAGQARAQAHFSLAQQTRALSLLYADVLSCH